MADLSLTAVSVVVGSTRAGSNRLLDGINLNATGGEFIAILGENGAGKSTLLKAIMGLMPLATGTILVDGQPLSALSPRERALRLAWLPQSIPLAWPLRVFDAVALGRFAHGGTPRALSSRDHAAVTAAMAACGLSDFINRSTPTLSGGEIARVHIARTFASGAPILLVDEPVAALDPGHRLAVMDLLKQHTGNGGTVIAVLHDLGLAARYADRIVGIRHGRLVFDLPPETAMTASNMADLFDVHVHIDTTPGWPQPVLISQIISDPADPVEN